MASEKTQLPGGWVAAPLSEAIQPRTEKVVPSDHPESRFIGMDHVESLSTKILGSLPAAAMKSSAASFRAGDVLYGRLRPYLNKVAQPNFDGLASAEFIVFPDTVLISSPFLKHRLNAADFVSYASHLNEGDRPRVSFDQIGEFEILIPPPLEQHRIVAKIEELFSELDRGIESLKTAREQLKVYRQAVLKHAFEGKLTAQWREENKDKLETPEQLLARIKQEREARYERQLQEWTGAVKTWEAKGKLGKKPTKPKKLKALSSDEVPTLPEGWSWFSLSAIAGNIQIGPFGSLLHKADYLVGGTPLVNPSHIRFQRIEPDRTLTVSAGKLHQLGKYVMHENDIVIGRRGEMGRCAVVTAAEAGWLCGTGSLFVHLLSSMNPHFYSWVLGSQRVKDFLAASSIGTTMQNLNEGILHRVPVPVCSRHEQDEVFREIET